MSEYSYNNQFKSKYALLQQKKIKICIQHAITITQKITNYGNKDTMQNTAHQCEQTVNYAYNFIKIEIKYLINFLGKTTKINNSQTMTHKDKKNTKR